MFWKVTPVIMGIKEEKVELFKRTRILGKLKVMEVWAETIFYKKLEGIVMEDKLRASCLDWL